MLTPSDARSSARWRRCTPVPWAASFSQLRLPSLVGLVLRVSQKIPGQSVQVGVVQKRVVCGAPGPPRVCYSLSTRPSHTPICLERRLIFSLLLPCWEFCSGTQPKAATGIEGSYWDPSLHPDVPSFTRLHSPSAQLRARVQP